MYLPQNLKCFISNQFSLVFVIPLILSHPLKKISTVLMSFLTHPIYTRYLVALGLLCNVRTIGSCISTWVLGLKNGEQKIVARLIFTFPGDELDWRCKRKSCSDGGRYDRHCW